MNVKFIFLFSLLPRRIPASIARFGVLLLTDSQAQDFGIESFISHERYDAETKQNDIAVIKLAKDVSFSDPQKIRPACLWQTNNIGQASTVASGFGYTQYGGTTSNKLLKVKLDIIDNSVCRKTFEDEDAVINGNQICAGVLAGAKDTCSGDSGGPIQIVLPTNKCASYIIGITSYGGYCGGKNSPCKLYFFAELTMTSNAIHGSRSCYSVASLQVAGCWVHELIHAVLRACSSETCVKLWL